MKVFRGLSDSGRSRYLARGQPLDEFQDRLVGPIRKPAEDVFGATVAKPGKITVSELRILDQLEPANPEVAAPESPVRQVLQALSRVRAGADVEDVIGQVFIHAVPGDQLVGITV